jgi:hypothetical protein
MIVLICLFLCYVFYKVVQCIRQRRSNLPCFRRRSNSRGEPPALMAPNGQGQTVNIQIQSSNESLTSLPDNQVQEDNPSPPPPTHPGGSFALELLKHIFDREREKCV